MPVGITERPSSTRVRMMSGAALVPVPGLAAYTAARGAGCLGRRPAPRAGAEGLHVLSVYAGPTDTPMLRRSPLAATMSPAESPHALAAAAVQALGEGRRALWRGSRARVAQLRAARDDPRLGDALRA